jgi:integrase
VVDFHALRHTYVTRLVRAGIPLAQVQILARHADVATTLKHYTHLSTAETAAALAALPPLAPPLAITPA